MKGKGIKLPKVLLVGEVGLTGEIRPIASVDRLVNEAEKMGFKHAIIPTRNVEKVSNKSIEIIGISNIREAISKIF